MPDIVTLLILWGVVVAALGFGLVGFTLHIKDEVRKGHRAVWVYAPWCWLPWPQLESG